MAIYLFKLVRGKIRENRQHKRAASATEESHLVPEYAPGQHQQQKLSTNGADHGATELVSPTRSVHEPLDPQEAARQKEEARRRSIRQWKLMIGLALPNFLAAVDVTIVAPAIPLISSHFSTSKLSMLYNIC